MRKNGAVFGKNGSAKTCNHETTRSYTKPKSDSLPLFVRDVSWLLLRSAKGTGEARHTYCEYF
jgi:hypothetical protein